MNTMPAAFSGLFDFPFLHNIQGGLVQIIVNGETETVEAMTVLRYLEIIAIDPRRVAVELNLDILPKEDYGQTLLSEGDRLEIVQFVGGG
jgi:sulfur carrier protein